MIYFMSWKQFLETVLVILVCYYAVIIFFYYKADLKKVLSLRSFKDIKRIAGFRLDDEKTQGFTSKLFQTPNSQEVSDFIAEVQKITREKAYLNKTNEGLLVSLHSFLSAAPSFLKTDKDFRNDVNNLIVSTCLWRLANESGKEVIDNLWESTEEQL